MSLMNTAVFGVFRLKSQVLNAKNSLLAKGFNQSEFKIQYPEAIDKKDISRTQTTLIKPYALNGAIVGGLLFFVIASLSVFDFLPIFKLPQNINAFQQILITIGGGLLGVVYGGFSGLLVGIGTSQKLNFRYNNYSNAGAILMSVTTNTIDKKQFAEQIFLRSGAQDITTQNETTSWTKIENTVS